MAPKRKLSNLLQAGNKQNVSQPRTASNAGIKNGALTRVSSNKKPAEPKDDFDLTSSSEESSDRRQETKKNRASKYNTRNAKKNKGKSNVLPSKAAKLKIKDQTHAAEEVARSSQSGHGKRSGDNTKTRMHESELITPEPDTGDKVETMIDEDPVQNQKHNYQQQSTKLLGLDERASDDDPVSHPSTSNGTKRLRSSTQSKDETKRPYRITIDQTEDETELLADSRMRKPHTIGFSKYGATNQGTATPLPTHRQSQANLSRHSNTMPLDITMGNDGTLSKTNYEAKNACDINDGGKASAQSSAMSLQGGSNCEAMMESEDGTSSGRALENLEGTANPDGGYIQEQIYIEEANEYNELYSVKKICEGDSATETSKRDSEVSRESKSGEDRPVSTPKENHSVQIESSLDVESATDLMESEQSKIVLQERTLKESMRKASIQCNEPNSQQICQQVLQSSHDLVKSVSAGASINGPAANQQGVSPDHTSGSLLCIQIDPELFDVTQIKVLFSKLNVTNLKAFIRGCYISEEFTGTIDIPVANDKDAECLVGCLTQFWPKTKYGFANRSDPYHPSVSEIKQYPFITTSSNTNLSSGINKSNRESTELDEDVGNDMSMIVDYGVVQAQLDEGGSSFLRKMRDLDPTVTKAKTTSALEYCDEQAHRVVSKKNASVSNPRDTDIRGSSGQSGGSQIGYPAIRDNTVNSIKQQYQVKWTKPHSTSDERSNGKLQISDRDIFSSTLVALSERLLNCLVEREENVSRIIKEYKTGGQGLLEYLENERRSELENFHAGMMHQKKALHKDLLGGLATLARQRKKKENVVESLRVFATSGHFVKATKKQLMEVDRLINEYA